MKFILIFFLVIYLIGYLGKLFLRNWFKKFSEQNQNPYEQNNFRPEGEVTVNKNRNKSKSFNQTDGEYIDYEEID